VQRTPTRAYADTTDTRLGRAVGPVAAANAGKTGVHALPNGRDAFAARVLLAQAAERSLDVQYYIWHLDTSGGLLAQALWAAAERGVRVRMLLDDINTQNLTTRSRPSMGIRTSRCACSTRSRTARGASPTSRRTSRA
jgi:putative cardiolipin synthase